MAPGNFEDLIKRSRAPEGVYDDDRAGSRGDGLLDPGRIKIQSLRIDINEDGHGALVAKNIGDGNESKRGNNDFIAFGDAQRAYAQMKGAGAGIHSDGVRGADALRDGMLKFFQLRAEAEAASA